MKTAVSWPKRTLDIVLSGLGLLVSLPLWGVIALAVKLQDRGPIFFRDQRVGQDGHVFGALKFRTMLPTPIVISASVKQQKKIRA
jgi:lipopolysaccharide/colanic/teichoic acid biosynthesis glycosyltransferase